MIEQSVWALGNIAGDGAALRDEVIRCGAVKYLLRLANQPTTTSFLRNLTWSLSNLCRNKDPSPSLEVIRQLLPTIINLVNTGDLDIQGKSLLSCVEGLMLIREPER